MNIKNTHNIINSEKGIAIILALVMLLVMSVMAITIAFYTNTDFFAMRNYKRGQEAFLAAEKCLLEVRRQFEVDGVETLFFKLQGNNLPGIKKSFSLKGVDCSDSSNADRCAVCRTGRRSFNCPSDGCSSDSEIPYLELPPPTKALGRPVKHISLPSGGIGGAQIVGTTFTVIGKDARDLDKDDTSTKINTGVEIAAGIESIVPGGSSNVY
ncbi:MAG: hypothetical protein GTO02_11515 [Candidatus Dadabacteria bacterium]|nr:hypothetical protein [Candidatus Dadabacteria bacterium]NIQ14984.1 hypothetical protein [Candidatus Dadabacteria bacterium]